MTEKHHARLRNINRFLPEDYEPYGEVRRWSDPKQLYPDCSYGCVFFYELKSKGREPLGNDWGVCGNPASHRHGLLTFEHQGCQKAKLRTVA